jgi:hypothetical protein
METKLSGIATSEEIRRRAEAEAWEPPEAVTLPKTGFLEGSIPARISGGLDSGSDFRQARFWQAFLTRPILARVSARGDSGKGFW